MLDDIDADFSEFSPDEHLEAIRQQNEPFLTKLEALTVCAINSEDWTAVYEFINTFKTKEPSLMKRYQVSLPFTGYFLLEIEASSADEAKEIAFDKSLSLSEDIHLIGEWEIHDKVVEGNVFHGTLNSVEVEEMTTDD